jgi:hypothetical protein
VAEFGVPALIRQPFGPQRCPALQARIEHRHAIAANYCRFATTHILLEAMNDSEAGGRLGRALHRLDRAVERLERALAAHSGDGAELGRLEAALKAAEAEQVALADANRIAAERLEQTIGRLRGLLAS